MTHAHIIHSSHNIAVTHHTAGTALDKSSILSKLGELQLHSNHKARLTHLKQCYQDCECQRKHIKFSFIRGEMHHKEVKHTMLYLCCKVSVDNESVNSFST